MKILEMEYVDPRVIWGIKHPKTPYSVRNKGAEVNYGFFIRTKSSLKSSYPRYIIFVGTHLSMWKRFTTIFHEFFHLITDALLTAQVRDFIDEFWDFLFFNLESRRRWLNGEREKPIKYGRVFMISREHPIEILGEIMIKRHKIFQKLSSTKELKYGGK